MDAESVKQLTTDINNIIYAQTKPLHVQIEKLIEQLETAWKGVNGIKNENKRLKAALKDYGAHTMECIKKSASRCTCGLDAMKGK